MTLEAFIRHPLESVSILLFILFVDDIHSNILGIRLDC